METFPGMFEKDGRKKNCMVTIVYIQIKMKGQVAYQAK